MFVSHLFGFFGQFYLKMLRNILPELYLSYMGIIGMPGGLYQHNVPHQRVALRGTKGWG